MKRKSRKLMIVGGKFCDDLETHLIRDGWAVIWVYDAKTAIANVRRGHFDVVVLISTGKEMDVMETFFNLRDIRKSLSVIVVRQPDDAERPIEREFCVLPNSGLQSAQGLDGLFRLLSNEKTQRSVGLD